MFLTKALRVSFRALWFTASTIFSIWFLFWILYDILVWNKTLTQVNLVNYFGLTLSITLLILGTKIGKSSILKKILHLKQNFEKKQMKKTIVQQLKEGQQKQPVEQAQEIQPTKKKEKQIPSNSSIPPRCKFYLGYLHDSELEVIPEECLECGNVVSCISPTARSIEECEHSKS